MDSKIHQNQLSPKDNKFHVGNGSDGKHYWLTPPELYAQLDAEFNFDFDPCPFPKPESFDGLTCDWGQSNYVNPPFGSIIHQGKKKGPTAWVRKCIEEWQKGKRVVLVYPIDKWVLMLLKAIVGENGHVRNLGDVRWLATEDGSRGKGTGRHIACFILEPCAPPPTGAQAVPAPAAVPVYLSQFRESVLHASHLATVPWLAKQLGELLHLIDACSHPVPAPPFESDGWIDVSERKPSEAQQVLFVLDGKTVAGAWIGEIFWYSNQKRVARWWQPLPKPPISAATHPQPADDKKEKI